METWYIQTSEIDVIDNVREKRICFRKINYTERLSVTLQVNNSW